MVALLQTCEVKGTDPGHTFAENEKGALAPVTLDRCRELLQPASQSMSDHELDLLREHASVMAAMILEMFLSKR